MDAHSLDGVALGDISSAIVVVDAATQNMTTIVYREQWGTSWRDPGTFNGPCFSPDGRQIAFLAHDWYGSETENVRRWMIYIADNNGLNRDSICETYSNEMHNYSCLSWTTDNPSRGITEDGC